MDLDPIDVIGIVNRCRSAIAAQIAEGRHLSGRRDPRRYARRRRRAARDSSGPYVEQRSLIVGKVARLTLLPGHAIPFSGVSNRKLVANGAEVKLIYSEGGLFIMTTGAACLGRLDWRHRQGPQQ